MKATLQFLLPGERARMMLIAACIGLMGNLVGYLTLLPGMIRWVDKRFPGKLKNF